MKERRIYPAQDSSQAEVWDGNPGYTPFGYDSAVGYPGYDPRISIFPFFPIVPFPFLPPFFFPPPFFPRRRRFYW